MAVLKIGEIIIVGGDTQGQQTVNEVAVKQLEVLSLLNEVRVSYLEQDFVPGSAGEVVDSADEFPKVNIREGVPQLAYENSQATRPLGLEPLRKATGAVAEPIDRLKDAFPRGWANPAIPIVEHQRNRGERSLAFPGHVFDRNASAFWHIRFP